MGKQCKYIPQYFDDPSYSIFNELKSDIIAYHQRLNEQQSDIGHLDKISLPNEICYDLKQMKDSQKKAMNVRLINDKKQLKRQQNDCFKASLQCYIERSVYETPVWSKRAKQIIDELCRFYECDLIVCSMNYYKNGDDFAKFHFDKYKYHKNHQNKPDITIGASFGASRDLAFESCANKKCKIVLQQNNGDLFSFSDVVNEKFRHSVPKISDYPKERISIIVWGKSKKSNGQNRRYGQYRNENKNVRKYDGNKRTYSSYKGPSRW